jgi:hypothetical protein
MAVLCESAEDQNPTCATDSHFTVSDRTLDTGHFVLATPSSALMSKVYVK